MQILFQFNIRVEWPGKEQQAAQPKGYVYIIFESDKQVKALLSACILQVDDSQSGGIYYFKISSRRIKAKDVCTSNRKKKQKTFKFLNNILNS